MRTLVVRTGLSRGTMYSGGGFNLTEEPEGAGNHMVGSWSRDFSSIMPGADLVPTASLVDNEWCVILADGRDLRRSSQAGQDDFYDDLDNDEDTESTLGMVVQTGDKSCTLTRVSASFRFAAPNFGETGVKVSSEETGEGGTDTLPTTTSLLEYLDNGASSVLEADGDLDVWLRLWAHLRCVFHWAIVQVPCYSADEGLSNADNENDPNAADSAHIPARPRPLVGPRSYFTGADDPNVANQELDGGISRVIHLWEPCDDLNIISRGEFEMPFTLNASNELSPGAVAPDVDADFDLDDPEAGSEPYAIRPSVSGTLGRNGQYRLNVRKTVQVKPDHIVFLIIQTSPCRLARSDVDNLGTADYENVIYGPAVGFPFIGGPTVRLYHWSVVVHHTTRS